MTKSEVVFQKLAKEKNDPVKKTILDLGAGAAAGAASGFIVAPMATVADLAGTNAKSKTDSFYKMGPMQITKKLWSEGKASGGVVGGIKNFYGGQGLKVLKMIPQNALNLAIFSALTGAFSNSILKNK